MYIVCNVTYNNVVITELYNLKYFLPLYYYKQETELFSSDIAMFSFCYLFLHLNILHVTQIDDLGHGD